MMHKNNHEMMRFFDKENDFSSIEREKIREVETLKLARMTFVWSYQPAATHARANQNKNERGFSLKTSKFHEIH